MTLEHVEAESQIGTFPSATSFCIFTKHLFNRSCIFCVFKMLHISYICYNLYLIR